MAIARLTLADLLARSSSLETVSCTSIPNLTSQLLRDRAVIGESGKPTDCLELAQLLSAP